MSKLLKEFYEKPFTFFKAHDPSEFDYEQLVEAVRYNTDVIASLIHHQSVDDATKQALAYEAMETDICALRHIPVDYHDERVLKIMLADKNRELAGYYIDTYLSRSLLTQELFDFVILEASAPPRFKDYPEELKTPENVTTALKKGSFVLGDILSWVTPEHLQGALEENPKMLIKLPERLRNEELAHSLIISSDDLADHTDEHVKSFLEKWYNGDVELKFVSRDMVNLKNAFSIRRSPPPDLMVTKIAGHQKVVDFLIQKIPLKEIWSLAKKEDDFRVLEIAFGRKRIVDEVGDQLPEATKRSWITDSLEI